MENFLRGHVGALTAWGGCPRVALYDNLKSAVLERQGSVIRFHPTLLALSGHYRFDPRPVARWRGGMRRVASSGPFAISATPSSPAAGSRMWTT